MENLINDMCQRTGIDRSTAEKVAQYMKDNMTRIPELLQGGGSGSEGGAMKGVMGKIGDAIGRRG